MNIYEAPCPFAALSGMVSPFFSGAEIRRSAHSSLGTESSGRTSTGLRAPWSSGKADKKRILRSLMFASKICAFILSNSVIFVLFIIIFSLSTNVLMGAGLIVSLFITSLLFLKVRAFNVMKFQVELSVAVVTTTIFTQSVLLTLTPLHSLVPEKLLVMLRVLRHSSDYPQCDMLTKLATAKYFFKDSVNFSPVKLYFFNEPIPLIAKSVRRGGSAYAWGNYIYILDETCLSDGTLVHELSHVWQFQQGEGFGISWVPKWFQYFVLYFSDIGKLYDYGGTEGLSRSKKSGKIFQDFGIEQQAAIVENYYLLTKNPALIVQNLNVRRQFELLEYFVPAELRNDEE